MNPQQHLREYLLGRLPETARDEMEQRFFEDETFEADLFQAEHDLLTDWAKGQLPAAESSLVERRFPLHKLAVARALATPPPRTAASPWRKLIPIAAALVICAGAALYLRQTPAPAPMPITARLDLNLGAMRGGRIQVETIPPDAARVVVTLPQEPGYATFQIRIESPRHGLVAAESPVHTGGRLRFELDARKLPSGDYDFLLYGLRDARQTLLASYPCRIGRK